MQNITPQKLQSLLSSHYNEVNLLLQKYHLAGPVNVQTIQQGFQKYGRRFAAELAAILAIPAGTMAGYDGEVTSTPASSGDSTAFWSTMNSLLGYAYQVYENERGGGSPGTSQAEPQPAIPENIAGIPLKTILIVMGAAIAGLVIFLIVKK
jgi:hypothetical protein